MESRARGEIEARLDPTARSSPRTRAVIGGVVVLVVAALIAAVVVGMAGAGGSGRTIAPTELPATLRPVDAGAEPMGEGSPDVVLVHVLGAVVEPGLYEIAGGSRVVDAVAAAGGFAESADQGGVNLARIIADGEQLYVPAVGEAPPPAVQGAAPAAVNLNTASVAELDTLPHIGATLAQRIIDWRSAHGRFTTVEDLRNVSGIGGKTFEDLKELVTV